ncbi:hypothetical protein [Psychrobacillus sp. FSL K6-2843]|uniref:hypothetical protein n=1 Tax=Psychrobacillus sp. FSL K6-2843 TaxID=2921549 RepID=UPI00315A772C
MKVLERKVELKHFLLGGYTIGFVAGCLGGLLSTISTTFTLSFSFESIFCIVVVLPIFYWVYRYSGMVFNDETMKMKLLYFFISMLGLFFGLFFSELLLS